MSRRPRRLIKISTQSLEALRLSESYATPVAQESIGLWQRIM